MKRPSLFLVLLVGITWAKDPITCCQKGRVKGALTLINNGNCESDDSVSSEFKGLNKLMCVGFYKQCCKSTAESQFCQMGERLALANQLCLKSKLVGGEAQKLCCECCKRGIRYGKASGSCEEQYSNHMCAASFKNCCERIKKQKTTEKPMVSKTCKDIVCDLGRASGCEETSSGPKCLCKRGYTLQIDMITCQDVNECAENRHNCQGADVCRNLPGTYECVPCESGYKKVGKECQKIQVPKCKDGHEHKNGKCVDIDECISGSHRCPTRSFCLNEEGDYRCLQNCPYPNYQVIRDGVCADVDECKTNTHNCYENFECKNSIGSYSCKRVRCNEGYNLVNGYCEDIDECKQENICGEMGICRNANGRYYCDCQAGYSVNPKTGKCVDVDECKINRAYCNHNCVNTQGSYKCTCPSGYQTSGRYCYDIDECSIGKPCDDSSFCFNTFGSFACINQSCPDPFFIRTARNSCRKINCYGNKTCEIIPERSIQWQAFKLRKNVQPGWFQFTYSLSRFPASRKFDYALVSGNEDRTFDILKLSPTKIEIFNSQPIVGPKDIVLVLHADVSENKKILDRFIYLLYIHVSPYNFSQ